MFRLLNARIVTYDEVFGGIDIYLLLGFIWALANMLIYTLDPGFISVFAPSRNASQLL